jgi:hypothetical protein
METGGVAVEDHCERLWVGHRLLDRNRIRGVIVGLFPAASGPVRELARTTGE